MYMPQHFREPDGARIEALIRDYAFATLIGTENDVLHVTHAPLMYDASRNVLTGHIARANPHQAVLTDGKRAVAIFHGPHSYISPTWYVDEDANDPNVPTWNYSAVHITGTILRIDDEQAKWKIVTSLAAQYEKGNSRIWNPKSESVHRPKLSAIVGFELRISQIQAKFKLSQNRSPADQASVVEHLRASSHPDGAAMAEWMNGNRTRQQN
jgi:transcriptional regulator